MAAALLYFLPLQKLGMPHKTFHAGNDQKPPPGFWLILWSLKCLLKTTYVGEVRAEDKVPRFLLQCQEQLGAVGGEHLWASFEVLSKALHLLQDHHQPL